MIKGTLKFFSAAKGFGFITPDGEGKDVFLPAATIAACGSARLQAGQRVSFEQEADVKGPKAVRLALLDEAPVKAVAPTPQIQLTLYCDPSSSESAEVLATLRAAGHQPQLVDYTVSPPERAELQRMSLVLRNADQSLVRRYNPLFLDLQLDDRFIAENDFWTAIVEHPALINGPVLAAGSNIRICKTAGDVRAFLGLNGAADAKKPPKELSPRMAAMMKGLAVPPAPAPAPPPAPNAKLKAQTAEKPAQRAAAKPKPKPMPEKAPAAAKNAVKLRAKAPRAAVAVKKAKHPATKKKGK